MLQKVQTPGHDMLSDMENVHFQVNMYSCYEGGTHP